MDYNDFLKSKRIKVEPSGFDIDINKINPILFQFQKDIVKWALKKGKAALFMGTGTGKSFCQLEFARHVCKYANGNVLILAPLAVAEQTVREGKKLGIEVQLCRTQADVRSGINITNYEMLGHFDAESFAGVVLDESSILKGFSSKTKLELIHKFKDTKFKLCCTATPSPNDVIELTNHAEFLGVMKGSEVLAMFFTHGSDGIGDWVLKEHAKEAFWKWVASWAVMLSHPADLGYDGSMFDLPELKFHEIVVDKSGYVVKLAQTLNDRRAARRDSIKDRVACAAKIANDSNEQVIVWCDLNSEADALEKAITDCVEVRGSDANDYKVQAVTDFINGKTKCLISKASMFGYGLNLQNCHKVIFVGLSDSFENYYQAVRRCWRFGQKEQVEVFVITSEKEGAVVANIKRKEKEFKEMLQSMIASTQELQKENLRGKTNIKQIQEAEVTKTDLWTLYNGDAVLEIKNIHDNSIHFSIFSPPFVQLFVYSNSEMDIGNCKSDEEFYKHFLFLTPELYRVLMPGRLMAVHCTQIPTSKSKDGYIGLKDFRGELIRIFQKAGFIYHSEICVWKDPVQEMYRTKSIRLLHNQLKKDSCISGQGRADYILLFRKSGDNPEPVSHTNETFPVPVWQRYASPVWMDINQMDVLNYRSAGDNEDEKHICPLQLEVIRRCLELWTNPSDLVLSPFAGIGSEGFESVKMGRRFVGIELKKSYYEQAVKNLQRAEKELSKPKQITLSLLEDD